MTKEIFVVLYWGKNPHKMVERIFNNYDDAAKYVISQTMHTLVYGLREVESPDNPNYQELKALLQQVDGTFYSRLSLEEKWNFYLSAKALDNPDYPIIDPLGDDYEITGYLINSCSMFDGSRIFGN